ncbi:hypothetical protein Goklo_007524 [Gossypium klotzschianum]|uniref:Uncharacterized protein n=1 Tax=Gossypium klotzschianum TaxID=34286 RepID=A0A7J8UXQ7_9ROSI|nr:hypothetical protein [Gossypium klotzschianum]
MCLKRLPKEAWIIKLRVSWLVYRKDCPGFIGAVSTSFLAIISFGSISSGSSSFLDRTNVKIRHQDSLSQQSSFRRLVINCSASSQTS